jgi:hypothetical protein
MLPVDSSAMNLHVQLMTCSGMETWQAGIRHVAT